VVEEGGLGVELEGGGQGLEEGGGGGVDLASVEVDGGGSALFAQPDELAEEGGFADAAGAVDIEQLGRRIGGQVGLKKSLFQRAPDKLAVARLF
jgi:hypothetical protein